MAPSLLRKRRQQPTSPRETDSPRLRPSLSLPDLTTPLLDPESWEEIPPLTAFTNMIDQSGSFANITPTRHRKPSLVNHSTPIQFHRPFTPAQRVNTDHSPETNHQDRPDFRTRRAEWGRKETLEVDRHRLMGSAGGWRKKGKGKMMSRLNIVIVGAKGCGKSSFIQLLVDSLTAHSRDSTASTSDTPCSPTSPGPPISDIPPTTRLSSRPITISNENGEKTVLRLVDTPGLAFGNDPLPAKERERGLQGLSRMMEQQFNQAMREESKIVRIGPKGEDDLVHLVIYMIDARHVLPVPIDVPVDWSCVGVFDEAEPLLSHVPSMEPQVPRSDLEAIQQLSNRSNVLPILTRTDSLSSVELGRVRSAIQRDLAPLPRGGFGLFSPPEDEDEEEGVTQTLPDHMRSPEPTDPRDPRPLTPESSVGEGDHIEMPFAIFNPERREGERFLRGFPWGEANVLDPEQSDFVALKNTVLSAHEALRLSTREVLYERYRTEKLLEKQKRKDIIRIENRIPY